MPVEVIKSFTIAPGVYDMEMTLFRRTDLHRLNPRPLVAKGVRITPGVFQRARAWLAGRGLLSPPVFPDIIGEYDDFIGKPYNARFVRDLTGRMTVRGRTILEIGSGNGAVAWQLLRAGPRRIVGIDIDYFSKCYLSMHRRYSYVMMDASSLGFDDDTFDGAYSFNVFEHCLDLGRVLSEIHRVLKPGGRLYASFGPIWSSAVGHHYHVTDRHGATPHIPPFGHLRYSEAEMENLLRSKGLEDEVVRRAVEFIYRSTIINRLGIREIVQIVEASPFRRKDISFTRDTKREVPEEFRGKLPYSEDDLSIRDVELLLVK
ncbi:MAG: methyltransferase domain-containing protein [bacterium]|nr:methyltransferase domain-containing protein [bacterium]